MNACGVILSIAIAAPAGALHAQAGATGREFAEPRPVSPAGARAAQAALAVDPLGNAWIVMLVDGRAVVRITGSTLSTETALGEPATSLEDPSIEVGSRGQAFVAFLGVSPPQPPRGGGGEAGEGGEVFLSKSLAGTFGDAMNVSRDRADDRAPRLTLDSAGSPRLVWARRSGERTRVFYHDPRDGAVTDLGPGHSPSIAVGLHGLSLVAFVKDGALLVTDQGPDGFGPPLEVDRGIPDGAPAPAVGIDAEGRLAVVYVAAGELRLSVRQSGSFLPPQVLDTAVGGAASSLQATLSDAGRLAAAYLKDGNVYVIEGAVEGAFVPRRVTGTAEAEWCSGVREDPRGNLHLVFVRDGTVYYTNTAEAPRADFEARGGEGELPLGVEFRDLSRGEVQAWRWDFGDGGASTEREPAHTYLETGRYTVRLEVFGPGGRSLAEKTELITVREPSYVLQVAEVPVFPGQTRVWLPVIAEHRQPLQGFQITGRFDSRALMLRELTLESTFTGFYNPEFFVPVISNEEGYFTSGVILDYQSPYDGRVLKAGSDHRLLYLVFDVAPGAPPGPARVELGDRIGESKLGCMFAVEGTSRIPVLRPGGLDVLPASSPPPRPFIRGDTDQNLEVNLTDVVEILSWLFEADLGLPCPDAADSNDSGDVDISDPIYFLTALFLSGPPLPLPYPAPGLDPTPDGLTPCGG